GSVTVAVPRLPRISNFTDLAPLAREPGVRVAFVPLRDSLDDADAVVLPGTKNAVDDLVAARDAGLGRALDAFDGPVVGVCGGYQLLGERLSNASVEATDGVAADLGDDDAVPGFGLLPVETTYAAEKSVERVRVRVEGCGPLAGASGVVRGYEIHHGETVATGPVDRPLGSNSARRGPVVGTYLHGLFENDAVREAFVGVVFEAAGRRRPRTVARQASPFDAAASLVRDGLDLGAVGWER
ncbi:MAG TPA: cobyric acid synthase CobQ, partial [Halobacteriales archaeon]|nr:cobyric acid synthase CobQ [Halobacteriales archaeon]